MQNTIAKYASKYRKQILIVFDILVLTVSYLLPWGMIQGRVQLVLYYPTLVASGFFFICCFEVVFVRMGNYDSLWRYAEIVEFFRLVLACIIAIAVFVVSSIFIFSYRKIPISVFFLSAMFATSVILYSRLTYRMYRNTRLQRAGRKRQRRVMVVGAGEAAATLLHEQNRNPDQNMNFVCVVDDAPEKLGRFIMGVKIMGRTQDIMELSQQCEIDTIVLAIPSINEDDRQKILMECAKTSCKLRILPDLRQIMSEGGDLSSRIREVRVEDLLGRETISMSSLSSGLLQQKTVLVTGGGGSIGSELCRQIAGYGPKKLIILDVYENNAYAIQQELIRVHGAQLCLVVEIASVRDQGKIDAIFAKYRPDIVFHAAAHKHVPLMEYCPEEAVKNNVCGTYNVAGSASKYAAAHFVLISTDKAVNPTSVMGATKRLCEMIVQAMAQKSKTSFVAVRFGNVLGTNGSVLPLFKEQIATGGPLTVTHPDIVRYFMIIPEAVNLVLKAAAMAKGGEIFVLDMGKPVRILELAENLIKLAGFVPYKEIDIVFTGLRPGEKLYEELLMDEEGLNKTEDSKIFIGTPISMDAESLFDNIAKLGQTAHENNNDDLLKSLLEMLPSFVHSPAQWE